MSYSVFLRWFCTTSICECLPDQDDEPVGFLKLPKEIKAKWTPCILAMRNGWNWATQTLPDSALRLHMFWTIRTYSDHSLRPHCVTSAPNSACHGWTLGEGLCACWHFGKSSCLEPGRNLSFKGTGDRCARKMQLSRFNLFYRNESQRVSRPGSQHYMLASCDVFLMLAAGNSVNWIVLCHPLKAQPFETPQAEN